MRLGCAAATPDRDTAAFASFPSGVAGGRPVRFRKSPGRRGAEPITGLISYGGAEIMHLKFAKTAARIAAAGAVVATIGLGSAQMALAKPAPRVDVPCSAAALSSAITANTGGETLRLATFCVYKLT